MDPITIALMLTAIAGAGSAYQSKQAGKAQSAAFKAQAKDEETAARERELARKQKINKVLAGQIAGLGVSGISAEGSPQFIAQESIKAADLGSLADEATRSGRERNLLNQASASRSLGNLQAATTLLSTGASMYGLSNQPAPKLK
jgi:hypothetical protein